MHDPRLLYKYYFSIVEKENWFLASYLFRYILRSLNFDQDEDLALAFTALDEYSLDELRSMAEENTDVKRVLEIVEISIGKIEYPKNEPSNICSEPQAHDYSLVEPDTFFELVQSLESDWEKDNFLVNCFKCWLDEKRHDNNKIYRTFVKYIDEHGIKSVSYRVLDVLFPLIYEFESNMAFKYLDSLESDWEKDTILADCVTLWLNEQKYDKNKIYQVLVEYISKRGLKNLSYRVLDILFPLTYEFDSSMAFEYVCLAQAGNYWFTDTTYIEKFIEKCNFVKKYYPERYMEFYSESIKRSFNILGKKENFFVPIPRSIEFFSSFEELETMEKITDASIKFVDFLMGDLEFSSIKWTNIGDIDKIDLLLQRLEYPNEFVIEGARLGLDKLKENPLMHEIILKKIESNKE